MSVASLGESEGAAYTAAAAEINLTMGPSVQYRLFVSTAAWVRVTTAGGTAAAPATAGSHPVAAGSAVLLAAIGNRNRVSVIRDTVDGQATLSVVAAQP